ncbi:MAG: hypothetical protein WCK89_05705, partial [bacterium]
MSTQKKFSRLLKNWISLIGLFLGASALMTGTVLMGIDASRDNLSPYFGILIYLVVPGFIASSGLLVVLGMFLTRRRMKRQGYIPRLPVIDLGDRRNLSR